MGKHFRSPLFDAFRAQSPFQGLWQHASKMDECLAAMGETLAVYFANGDTKGAATRVSELEYEADLIKSNIRNHLPPNVRMSVSKPVFLQMLSEQDRILDAVEDAAIWMSLRPCPDNDEIKTALKALTDKVLECGQAYSAAVDAIHRLLETGFATRERTVEKNLVHKIHELEHQTDVLNRELAALVLAPTMEKKIGALGAYHILKLSHTIAEIADHAENAADRLRAMIAK